MERASRALNNIFFGFILRLATMIGPFVVRIIITRTIGREFLGVSGVFSSLLSALALTEMGFASAVAYKCYSFYAKKDYLSIRKYLAFFKKIYRMVGTIIIIIGLLLTPFLKYIVNGEIPDELNLYTIYFVYLFNTGVSYFLGAYKSVILTVSQRQDIESRIAVVCNSFMYIMQIIVLALFRNYYVYLIFLPVSTILINIIRIKKTNEIFPELYVAGMISNEEKKSIFKSIVPLIGHRLQGTIVISADNVIISTFIGVTMVAEYNNYYTIIAALGSFITAIYAAIQPGIGNAMAMDNLEKNYNDFKRISFAMIWIVGWMSICLVCLFEDFIEMAYGVQYKFGLITVLLLVAEFYIWRTFDIVMLYRDVVGRWSGDMIIPYISGSVNLIVNIVLVKTIGVDGVIISTIISFVFVSIPFSIRVLFHEVFNISEKEYLIRYLLRTGVVFLTGFFTYFLCDYLVKWSTMINFMVKGIVCLILPNLAFYLIWHRSAEYKYFKSILINRIKR